MESRYSEHEEKFKSRKDDKAIRFYKEFEAKKKQWLKRTGQKARYDFNGLFKVKTNGKKPKLVRIA